MRDSIVTVYDLSKLDGADDIAVLIDAIEYYQLLMKNGCPKLEAYRRVTQFNYRTQLHSAINNAIRRRQKIQRGELETGSILASHKEMHKHYLQSAKVARMFIPKLPR